MSKGKKRHLVHTCTCSSAYSYTCVFCTLYCIYMYAIATVHLDFFWALQVSPPDTWAHFRVPLQYIWISSGLSRCLVPTPGLTSEYPICRVCVCVNTHTHHIHINPLLKMGRHFPRTSESLTLETSTNHGPAGKPPRLPLFYICMQWCLKQL
jgi:hypothetical protein